VLSTLFSNFLEKNFQTFSTQNHRQELGYILVKSVLKYFEQKAVKMGCF
jgi:hypothetical protein